MCPEISIQVPHPMICAPLEHHMLKHGGGGSLQLHSESSRKTPTKRQVKSGDPGTQRIDLSLEIKGTVTPTGKVGHTDADITILSGTQD